MRPIATLTVPDLLTPSAEDRAGALSAPGTQAAHDALLAAWPALGSVELRQPLTAPVAGRVTVAAWNMERCKHVEASADLLRAAGADIVLATEMDMGCARSGQRHTTRDLADRLGMGYAYGVEFVELGLGNDAETAACAGQANRNGLHGNAILSRYPIQRARVIPVEDGGRWFTTRPKGAGQVRIGSRMAVAAVIAVAGREVAFASVHLESASTPDERAAQIARLLDGMAGMALRNGPALIGGDLNTAGFRDAGLPAGTLPADPGAVEPAFHHLAAAGFGWAGANTGNATTRLHPGDPQDRIGMTIDWLFTRGLQASEPAVIPAVSPEGATLSDHEMITARIGAEP